MKPYSLDFRTRVVELVNGGKPRAEVAELFGIGLATLKRWLVLANSSGDLRPTSPPGQPARITPDLEDALRALVAAHPDATLEEYAERWNAIHTPAVSHWTIGRSIRKLDLSRKKDGNRIRTRSVGAGSVRSPASGSRSRTDRGRR